MSKKCKSGTICMTCEQKSSLSSADVCAILTSCREAGVSELEFGALRVTFGRPPRHETQEPLQSLATEEEISANQVKMARESLELDELAVREQQIEELLLTDPAKAEQMIIDGQLEEVTDGEPDGTS